VITWNVESLRGASEKRRREIAARIDSKKPDLILLQEVGNDVAGAFVPELKQIGLAAFFGGIGDATSKAYGSMIASRSPPQGVKPGWAPAPWPQLLARATVTVDGREIDVISAHMPNGSANGWKKIDTFEALAASLARAPATPRVLFLRPEIKGTYTDGDDPGAFGFFRKFADQPLDAATRAGNFDQGKYLSDTRVFGAFPPCRWAIQLSNSKRKAICVFPLPFGPFDYGELATPANLIPRLKLFLRALVQEGLLSAPSGAKTPNLKRLALGGFSLSGDLAIKIWNANQSAIQELYLFDPGAGNIPSSTASWASADPDRKLQLICTEFSAKAARDIQAQNPGVTPRGAAVDFVWTDPTYRAAHDSEFTSMFGGGPVPIGSPPGTSVPGRASKDSGLFQSNQSGPPSISVTLKGTGTADGQSVTQQINGVAPFEAAVYVEGALISKFIKDPTSATVKDITNVLNGIPGLHKEHRHSWAIYGGEARTDGFHGFFQICLDESNFTKAP